MPTYSTWGSTASRPRTRSGRLSGTRSTRPWRKTVSRTSRPLKSGESTISRARQPAGSATCRQSSQAELASPRIAAGAAPHHASNTPPNSQPRIRMWRTLHQAKRRAQCALISQERKSGGASARRLLECVEEMVCDEPDGAAVVVLHEVFAAPVHVDAVVLPRVLI